MPTEDHKAHLRRLPEKVWNQGHSAVRDEVVATGYVCHHPSLTIQGQESFRQFVSQYRSAFPDFHFTIEEMLAVGDKVVVRCSVTGTHEG